jgi:hypothetical protein
MPAGADALRYPLCVEAVAARERVAVARRLPLVSTASVP